MTTDLGAGKQAPVASAETDLHPPELSAEATLQPNPAKPANQVTTDSHRPTRGLTGSGCEPYRELIELGLARGRNARAIWQDLVSQCGFASGYQSVKRFVRRLRGAQAPEAHPVIVTEPGQEAQVDYGSGSETTLPPLPLLVALGVKDSGEKILLALGIAAADTGAAWEGVLEHLAARHLGRPRLVISDGNPVLHSALERIWPGVAHQRCTVHKLRNLLAKAPEHAQEAVHEDYNRIVYAANRAAAEKARDSFLAKWKKRARSC